MDWLAAIGTWVSDPTGKTILLFVGGLILKKWGAFVNKAIPAALLVVSIIVEVLKALFPLLVPAAHAAADSLAVGAAVAVAAVPWWKTILLDVLVPTLLASGAQSQMKNTRQWADFGWRIFQTVRK